MQVFGNPSIGHPFFTRQIRKEQGFLLRFSSENLSAEVGVVRQ